MKRIKHWLITISLILTIVVLIDLTITWFKHPANNDIPMFYILATCITLIAALLLWFKFNNLPKNK